MEYIAVTVDGIEENAKEEIKELIGSTAKTVAKGRIQFTAEENKVKELLYITRSLDRVYTLKATGTCKTIEEIKSLCPKIKIKSPFKIKCIRKGKHNFSSKEIKEGVGSILVKQGYKVDLENPQTTIYIELLDDLYFIGIDITHKHLQKREYRIKTHNQSPNPLIAYAMLRLGNWDPSKILLDPFAKDGVIAIEAALYGANIARGYFTDERIEKIDKKINRKNHKIHCYDELLHNVRSCEINAKLADINKLITFSKIEITWLDVKFDKNTVDYIVTVPPFVSKDKDSEDIEKKYKELFHQAKYILKPKGIMVLLVHRTDLIKKYNKEMKNTKNLSLMIGDMKMEIQVYQKN